MQILKPEELCRGHIGSTGTKFCLNEKGGCLKASHRVPQNKATVNPGLYILDTKSGCFKEPFLDVKGLEETVISRILGLDVDSEKLRKEFVLVNSQDGSQDEEIDKFCRSNLKKAYSFKTPAKGLTKSGGLNSSNLGETVDTLMSLGTIADVGAPTKFEDQTELEAAVSLLISEVKNVKKSLPTIAGVVDTVETSLLDKTTLIYGSLQLIKQIEGELGTQTQGLKDAGIEPTIWAALANVITTSKMKGEKLENLVSKLNTEIQNLENSNRNKIEVDALNTLKTELFNVLTTWKTTIEETRNSVQIVEAKVTTLSNQVTTSTASPSSFRPTSTPSPSDMLASLGISGSESTIPNSHRVGTPVGEGLGGVDADIFKRLIDRVSKMEKQQMEHGREGLNGAVRFSGITLTGKDDLGAWLDENLESPGGVPPYGLFADPQLLLHWCWIMLSGGHMSTPRDLKDRLAVSMTQDKTYAVESCQHFVPLLFTGKKSHLLNTGGMEKSRLASIPTFESWDDASSEIGLKQQMSGVLNNVKESMSELIEEAFEGQDKVRAFALAMLHTSCSFIEKLGNYMTETYQNFKDVMGNSKSVWGLVTYVVEQIFKKDFGQVRSKTIGSIDALNRSSGIKIIWSAIRCVDVSQQLMSHGIKNAPAVSSSYVRFVITHSNMGKVNTIVEENKSLKRKVDELETTITSVKRLAEGAKKVADAAMSKVNAAGRTNAN